MAPQQALEEAKARWMLFVMHVASSRLSGEIATAAYAAGHQRRAMAEVRTAIGEAAAVISRAIDIRGADERWAPICEAMTAAADIHVAGLEADLRDFQRGARVRSRLNSSEERKIKAIGTHWTTSLDAARALYAQLGGDAGDLPTFSQKYETMKAELLEALSVETGSQQSA